MKILAICLLPFPLVLITKKYKKYVSKPRNNPKKDMKARDKSMLAGGHSTQSHSPIYE